MQTVPDSLFKAIADPTRRAIYERIAREGAQTVHALTDQSGVSQPAVSKHLGILKRAGLIVDQRSGRETLYSAKPNALAPLMDWVKMYDTFWNERIDQLEDLLKRMDQ
ncbi:ArsR family transcriptional regulator [bacterium]|nr:MAG: ArsR family transcriptional regulator [bacterium]